MTRSALAELLAHASAVVIPSHSETYGLVALEAGRQRCAGDRRALRWPPRGGDGTHRHPPPIPGPAALVGGHDHLLADPGYARRLGQAGHHFALTRTWERSTGETVAVYDGLLRRTAIGDLDVTA